MKKPIFATILSVALFAACTGDKDKPDAYGTFEATEVTVSAMANGKILFLEDVDEYLYHIDRMMMNLKRSGKLGKLAGLIVGSMTKMRDNEVPFGKTAEGIIADAVAEYAYPVCFNFPAGHQEDNRALILGREVTLKVNDEVRLSF